MFPCSSLILCACTVCKCVLLRVAALSDYSLIFLFFPILVVVKAGAERSFNFKFISNVRLKTAVDEASRQS